MTTLSESPGLLLNPEAVKNRTVPSTGIRVVVSGKGGVGKTTLTGFLAHLFARVGYRVLAVDGDPQQNLAATLGIPPGQADAIVPISRHTAYIREKTGADPGLSSGGFITLNPDVTDVVDRFSLPVAPNLRLLVMGGVVQAGAGCLCAEYTLLAAVLRNLQLLPDEVILLDTPAGMEHFGRAVADGFTTALIVADPTVSALSVANEGALLARQLGIRQVILAVNRVRGDEDMKKVAGQYAAGPFSGQVCLPYDPEILRREPAVDRLISCESAYMRQLRTLAGIIGDPGG
ncbi:MAG: AAA family ATPase [Methanoregulaceae archaeon]|nr:AAA family ATPase [Methanoregulaceae archaeon]